MATIRLLHLLAVCFLLISPSYGQTAMQARRCLLQAEELIRKKDASEALKAVSEGLDILRALKREDPLLASSLYQTQARAYKLLRDDPQVVISFEKAIALLKPLLSSEGRKYQQLLLEYGDYNKEQQRNDKAVALYLEALEFEPRPPQPERRETATLLHNLACAYRDQGELEQAFVTFSDTLSRKQRLLDKDDPSLATTLSEFGGVCRLLGRFELAERYLQQAREIRKVQKDSSPASYARVLNNLSLVKQAMGERREALRLVQESYEISLQLYGPKHPGVMISSMNLAQAYSSVGALEKAERFYNEALAVALTHYSPDSLEVANVTHNLGSLMLEMNDLEKARSYLERALAIRRERLPLNHQDLGPNLINLASAYRELGNDEKALDLYREALGVGKATLGAEHPELAYTLDLMAGVSSLKSNPEEVLSLTQQAYEIRRKAFGSKAAVTAYSLYSLALLSHQQGDLEKARELFKESLKVFSNELGADHGFTGRAAHHLGVLAWESQNREQALDYAKQEARVLLATTEEIFSFASERQRLAYSSKLKPYDLPASLGAAEELATAVLRYKGAVLDSVMEDLSLAQQSSDPKVQQQVEALLQVREQLSYLLGEPNEAPQAGSERHHRDADKLALLRDKLEQLEAKIARGSYRPQELRRVFRVTPEEVVKALPSHSVLIELVRYGQLLERGERQESYGAVVLAPGQEPSWVFLGPAREIEALTSRYKRFVRRRGAEAGSQGEILRELHRTVWEPLEKVLPPGTTTVVISPDSELNFISFATLIGEDQRFLAQQYDLLYVSSGRDLLRKIPTRARSEAVLIGDPIFADSSLEPLPFTRLECQALTKLFQSLPGWQVKEFLGTGASEAQVKAVSRPALLHIATHGYFGGLPSKREQDPMAASGLVLAAGALNNGAGVTEDGYLTAGEVSLLDLAGTSLVSLSACDTGLGLAQAGEGVLGLRRGFLKAGAHHLVMTLWPVPDETTSDFMQDFLARAQKTPPALALAQTQRDWLERLALEHSPAEAVRQVGPFVLNLQGRWVR